MLFDVLDCCTKKKELFICVFTMKINKVELKKIEFIVVPYIKFTNFLTSRYFQDFMCLKKHHGDE